MTINESTDTALCLERGAVRYESSCGLLWLRCEGGAVSLCDWRRPDAEAAGELDMVAVKRLMRWLDGYFAGSEEVCQLPVRQRGTSFQQQVWAALSQLGYGEVCSYTEVAARAGCPSGVRAVANAVGANRVSIVVPCHRVIRADGTIGGYRGGLEAKRWLLDHEAG